MLQSTLRFTRLSLAAGSLLLGMLGGRAALATDIPSPASVNLDIGPVVLLNQTGSGPIPAYQWQILGNDFNFFVQDVTAGGNAPFKINIGSDEDLLHLSGSNVGIGTSSPQRKLHLKDGVMRFDDTSGIAQIWELIGDDISFDIFDFTSGIAPFSIKPGAPTASLFVDASGRIGLGTASPAAALHVRKAAQASTAEIMARFETTDDSVGSLVISNNSAGDGTFIPKITGRSASQNAALINEAIITNDVGASPAIAYNAVRGAGGALSTRPLVVYRNNSVAKVTIAANGAVTATSFNPVSSRTRKHDITDLDPQTAAAAVGQLTPVQFVYDDDETNDKRVGFIAEDVPEIVAAADRQSVPIMDVVALVTRVVKDQQQTIDRQQQTIDELTKRVAALENPLPR